MKTILTNILRLAPIFISIPLIAGQATIAIKQSSKVDFGKYPANLKKEAFYAITNAGDDVLKIIKIRKTCGCSEAKVDKTELKPGETAKLKAVIKADSIYGPFSKNIYIESNDPKQRFLSITLSGHAVPIAKIKPKNKIYAGSLKVGQKWTQAFLVEPTQNNVEFDQPVVKGFPAHVTLTKQPNGKLRLVAEVLPQKTGALKCKISLPIKSPLNWKPLEIIIAGSVKGK